MFDSNPKPLPSDSTPTWQEIFDAFTPQEREEFTQLLLQRVAARQSSAPVK